MRALSQQMNLTENSPAHSVMQKGPYFLDYGNLRQKLQFDKKGLLNLASPTANNMVITTVITHYNIKVFVLRAN